MEEEYDPVSSGSKSSKGKLGGAAKQEQFKGHLNGLYDGLAKIMTKTCNIEPVKNSSACAIEKIVQNIMFIKHHIKRQDEYDAVSYVRLYTIFRFVLFSNWSKPYEETVFMYFC